MPTGEASAATGAFCYDESGFRLLPAYGTGHYLWTDLHSAFGFKLDYLTVDEICLDLFFSSGSYVRLTESLPGWPLFLRQLGQQFSTIPPHWEWEVIHPPFASNLTLLFDRAGRTLPQAAAAWYKT